MPAHMPPMSNTDTATTLSLLVEPKTLLKLKKGQECLIAPSGKKYCITGHNVVNFMDDQLMLSQMLELEFAKRWIAEARAGLMPTVDPAMLAKQGENCWQWSRPWLDNLPDGTSIVCLGSSFVDDIPHVTNARKFSVDHLAHEYIKMVPEMANVETVFVSAKTSHLPFADASVDIVYTRNAVDHFDNPVKSIMEAARILKPGGRLLLAVYYNSTFMNNHESFVVNAEFVSRVIKPLFEVEFGQIEDVPQQLTINGEKTGFIQISAIKKNDAPTLEFSDADHESIEKSAVLFHEGFFAQEQQKTDYAVNAYCQLLALRPVFEFDVQKLVYAALFVSAARHPDVFRAMVCQLAMKSPTWGHVISLIAAANNFPSDPIHFKAPTPDQFDIPGVIAGDTLLAYINRVLEK